MSLARTVRLAVWLHRRPRPGAPRVRFRRSATAQGQYPRPATAQGQYPRAALQQLDRPRRVVLATALHSSRWRGARGRELEAGEPSWRRSGDREVRSQGEERPGTRARSPAPEPGHDGCRTRRGDFRARTWRAFAQRLFFSSQSFGSHSSTLLPSRSRIQANLPFSADSGPFKTCTPAARSDASRASRSSTR